MHGILSPKLVYSDRRLDTEKTSESKHRVRKNNEKVWRLLHLEKTIH